jgi:hypothetical protein
MRLDQPQRCLWGIRLGLAVLVLGAGCRGPTKEVETVSDAAEARIGVMTGSIGETIARNRFPKAKVLAVDDVMDAVTAIKSGQLEAVVLALPAGFQITKRNADLVVLEETLDNEETAVALRKDDQALLGQVNHGGCGPGREIGPEALAGHAAEGDRRPRGDLAGRVEPAEPPRGSRADGAGRFRGAGHGSCRLRQPAGTGAEHQAADRLPVEPEGQQGRCLVAG